MVTIFQLKLYLSNAKIEANVCKVIVLRMCQTHC